MLRQILCQIRLLLLYSNDQTSETSNVVTLRDNQKNENSSNEAVDSVQNVTSNTESNVSAENKAPSTESATPKSDTPEVSAPAESNANTSAAPAMRMATSTTTGYDRNAAGTVDENNENTQGAEENKKLANETGLTSSDNYSSNIYKGTDGNYYKVITIYGNDYVYRPVKVYANGTATGQWATNERDTRANIITTKEDLGNGKVKWTVVFFPNKGLTKNNSTVSGLQSAKFGVALTKDYRIIGDVTVTIDSQGTYIAMDGHGNEKAFTPDPEVTQSFNPATDVDPSGWVNSSTMPGENNDYLLGPYYFTTDSSWGKTNLGNTFFKEDTVDNNVYTQQQFIGEVHDLWTDNYTIRNEDSNALDGGDYYKKHLIYDPLYNGRGGAYSDGFFNSDDFGSAMIFKSQGKTGTGKSQNASYTISFVTQHTDSYQSDLAKGPNGQQFSGIIANTYSYQNAYYNMYSIALGEQRSLKKVGNSYVETQPGDKIPNWQKGEDALARINKEYLNDAQINVLRNKIQNNITDSDALNNIIDEGNSLNDAMKNLGNSIGQYDSDGKFTDHKVDTTKASDRYQYADSDKKSAYDTATDAVSNIISVKDDGTVDKSKGTYADQATVEKLTDDENKAWSALDGVKPKDNEVNSPIGGTITIEKGHTLDSTDAANAITNKGSLTNVKSYSWSGTPDTSKPGSISPEVIVKYSDGTADNVPVTVKITGDANNYNPEGGEITVNRNTKLGPTEAEEAIKNAQSLPKGTTYSWAGEKLPDTSTSGQKKGWVVVTYPDTSRDIVLVKINVKTDAESYTVTPKDKVSVDKGEDVDPSSLVNVTGPDGKPTTLPAGSIEWKDTPDLTTPGDKTGSVEVTFPDESKKDTDVTIYVKTDAETYDPQPQPWTTTVGKTPKADEIISSTDKNGKKMPSDAEYTWKTEPNTSKSGEASGEVTVTYDDGSHDDVSVTINVKDKLDDNEKYHIYGKDGLKVDKGQTLDPKDAIDVKDADGNETTLPENSKVEWTKEPDFSQAGKDVTGEVTVTYPGGSKSDPVTVTVHVNGESDNYKVAPKDDVTVPRGSQVDPESTVVAQTPDGKPTSFPDGTKHEWITKPDTDSTGKRTGVVKTTFPDGSTTTTTVSVTVEPNQSDKYDPKGPKNPDDRVPVKDPDHLTGGDEDKVKDEVGKVNPDLPKGTEVEVDDKGNATITYPDGSKDTIPGSDLVRQSKDADKITPKVPDTKVPVADLSHLTEDEKDQVKTNVTDANKDNFPDGSQVTVGDDGTATVTYPDGSKDTIPGSDLVRQSKDADKITPKVPDTKVPVADLSHLTEDEKDQVKTNVTDANKDNFPDGSQVTVGDDGTATVTYPDGSKDTIPGSDLVRQSKDADKITPKVPDTKVPVADPSHLTDSEKDQVKTNVTDANKDNLPSGSQITVGNDGTTTVTYPDGSKDTIPGSDLVRQSTDADKTTPSVPETKVPVADPSHLTDSEKDQVKTNVTDANKDNLPSGSQITVGNDGTTTVTYPDGSKDTIPGSQLVTAKGNGNTTNSNVKVTPTNTNNKINKDNNSLGKNTANAKAGELPQTGETNDSQKLSVIGMALMGILGLFGLGKKRKKD
ncbi:LEA family epithelial adhesin [Ligilactobacillus salivarius]|uniref:LEA family epithelial adhesin n=9 Tax=Ligilactobacillus salivarius TaxID=1624 RepID=UPI0034E8DBCB